MFMVEHLSFDHGSTYTNNTEGKIEVQESESMRGPLNTTLVNGYESWLTAVDVSKHQILVKCYLWPVLKCTYRKYDIL